jgi:hypothetical protein
LIASSNYQPPLTHDVSLQETKLLAKPAGFQPKLTLEWIRQQVSAGGARSGFAAFYKKCKVADEFYFNSFEFDVPEGGNMIRLGTGHSIINTLVAHVSPAFIDIDVPPAGSRSQARAERTAKFLSGLNHMMEQNTQYGRREIAKHAGLYGVAWEKVEFNVQEWGGFPEPPGEDEDASNYLERLDEAIDRRQAKCPIVSEAINPQELFWDVNSRTPQWVVRFTRMDSEWVRAHFPKWKGQSGKVDFIEAWTGTHVMYVADDRIAMDAREHGYHALPWVMYRPQTGLRTLGNKPEQLYRGSLDGLIDMLRAQSRMASQHLDITSKVAWPTADWTGPRGVVEEAMNEYDSTPGTSNYLPTGVERHSSELIQTPPALLESKQMLEEAIEADSVPAVARGQRPTGAASGFHTSVLAGIAALNFGAVVDAVQKGIQGKNELALRIVELVIRDRVTVFGKTEAGNFEATLAPKDIKGHYVSIVRLNTVSPEEAERKINLWSGRWREGFVDHQTALRNAGVSNPLEVIAARQAEDFLNSDTVRQAISMEMAKRVPLLQQALEAAEGGQGSTQQIDELTQNILNTQGATQLPNAGNFAPGNNAGNRPQTPGTGPPTTTRPVMPGSIQEMNLIGRQASGPRSGNRRVPGADLLPGGIPA